MAEHCPYYGCALHYALRSTMTQERLNHIMVLHVHKDMTDSLNLKSVGNFFVAGRGDEFGCLANFKVLSVMQLSFGK